MKKYFVLVLAVSSLFAQGQEVNLSDFEGLIGNWQGSLTYLDYGDDKTRVSLETRLEAAIKGNELKMDFYYTEPNGEVVIGKEKIAISERKGKWFVNKGWEVLSFEKTNNTWTLLVETKAKDNNKKSIIRKNFTFETSSVKIEKLVKYNGTDQFFQRHVYVLESI